MTRPRLSLAPHHAKPAVPYSLLKQACRMFKGSYLPRDGRHINIRKWLVAVEKLGDKSLLAEPVQRIA